MFERGRLSIYYRELLVRRLLDYITENMITYIKQTNYGAHILMLAYQNSKVSSVAWNEHFIHYQNVIGEIIDLGFTSKDESDYLPTRNFTNIKNKKRIYVTMRPRTRDEFITISS